MSLIIQYKNKKLQKQLTVPKELFKNFGQIARKINQRIDDLKAADNPEVVQIWR